MTQDRFLKFLDNTDLLASIPYEELKTLALAYPYAHNLRQLLAIKSRQEHKSDFEKTLATASAYSLDRRRLFQILAPKQLAPQRVAVLEKEQPAVLELKPIETVQRELLGKTPTPAAAPRAQAVATPPPAKEPDAARLDLRDLLPQKQPEKMPPAAPTLADVPKPAAPVLSETPPPRPPAPSPVEPPKPTAPLVSDLPKPPENQAVAAPASAAMPFGTWAGQFNLPLLKGASALPQEPRKQPALSFQNAAPAAPKSEARLLAEKSLAENKDLVSETLARLYVRQGYYEKAIAMYERLCLAFPEKSHSFAAEIDKLKK